MSFYLKKDEGEIEAIAPQIAELTGIKQESLAFVVIAFDQHQDPAHIRLLGNTPNPAQISRLLLKVIRLIAGNVN